MKAEQITAWALHELSAEEQAQLEVLLKEDAEVEKQAKKTKDFCDFLLTELQDDSLALSEAQRAKTMEGMQSLGSATLATVVRQDRQKSGDVARRKSKEWKRYVLPVLAAAAMVTLFASMPLMMDDSPTILESRKVVADSDHQASAEAQKIRVQAPSEYVGGVPIRAQPAAAPKPATVPMPEPVAAIGQGPEQAAASSLKEFFEVPQNRVEMKIETGNLAANTPQRTMMLSMVNEPWSSKMTSEESGAFDDNAKRRGTAIDDNTESYHPLPENEMMDVVRVPLSTFSIDVDTASYANVRRYLNQNTLPPRDAVRLEELINYFPIAEEGPVAQAKEPFAVRVQMASCPWQPQHRLARVVLKGREVGKERKASNLVFLVDVSGSMQERNKLPLVQQSLRMLTEQLGEKDRVSMVTYAGASGVVLASTAGDKKADIRAAIDRLHAGGSTNGSAGIQSAYEQAMAGFIQDGVNRVILCSDGDFNVGLSSSQELETLIAEKARSGVFLSVLGYGTGNLKDHSMETLADKGNGNYAYIDSMSEARKVLVEQMHGTLVTIAKDVKVQIEFNPAVIRSYRLIGYENRLLAKEDFNDDTKDAGEIGAGHNVTALYELVPTNLAEGEQPRLAVDKLKYQREASPMLAAAPSSGQGQVSSKEALTVKLRYKQPEGTTSELIEVAVNDDARSFAEASEEFKFSAAVAGFGLLLRDSGYRGKLTWDQVRKLALEGKGKDEFGYRGEFIQLIEKARGLKR